MLRVDGSGIQSQPNIKVGNKSNKVIGSQSSKNKGFEDRLNSKSSDDLVKVLKDINNKGIKLSKTLNYMDALSYKKAIQSYLKDVMEHMYSLNKTDSFWGNKYYSVVEEVDSELCVLTSNLLKDESDSIEVLKSIDKIEGMLVEIMA